MQPTESSRDPIGAPDPAPVTAEDASTRDRLATERTVLANERTLLAYIRTALAFAIAGASAIHFLGSTAVRVIGWFGVVAGVITGAIGTWRFARTRRLLLAPPQPADRAESTER